MINILGLRRVIVLGVLIAANIVIAFATYSYFIPIGAKLQKQIRNIRNEVATKQADTEQLRREAEEIAGQQSFYSDLEGIGFFSDQSRIEARRNIEDIQRISRALRVQYDMKPAEIVPNNVSEDSGYVFLDTPVTMTIDVIDDADLYKFLYWIQNAFPGHVSFTKVDVKRLLDVNEANLKRVSEANPAPMASGAVEFRWRTMVPKSTSVGAEGASSINEAGGKK